MPTTPPTSAELITAASARTLSIWTPALIRAAEAQAGHGNLMLAADLVEGLIFADDRAPAVGRTRSDALFGLRPTFEPGSEGDGRRHGRVVKAMEGGEDYWSIFPTAISKQIFTWGLFLGVAPVRLNWWETLPVSKRRVVRQRKGRHVPVAELWHPRDLRLDPIDQAWKMRLAGGRERVITPGDGEWMLFTPYGPFRPWTMAPWRGLARWLLLKQLGIGDWGRHGEQASQTVVETDKEVKTTPELRKELASTLKGAGANAKVVLPPGMHARRLENTSSGDLYRQQGEAADKADAVALLGHAINAESGSANTGAQASEGIRLDIRMGDAEVWSEFTRDGGLTWWAEINFGDPELAPWACYPAKKPDALASKGAGYKALGDGLQALRAADPAVDVHKLLEDEQLPLLTPEQAAAAAAARAPSPPPPLAPAAPQSTDPAAPAPGKATTQATTQDAPHG